MSEENCWLPCDWGVCSDLYDVDKRGVLKYNKTFCNSECDPGQISDMCANISPGTRHCYKCNGTWDGCIERTATCAANDLKKQCEHCNSSSEVECELQKYNETCESVEDWCMTFMHYDIRGVVDWVYKGCSSRQNCYNLNATNQLTCVNSNTEMNCTECNEGTSICGSPPTTPRPCSGEPKCFKCSESSISRCNENGYYTNCSSEDMCIQMISRDKFGVLQSVKADCSSNFPEYEALRNKSDYMCPGTTEMDYNQQAGEYTCSPADRCTPVIDNCSNPAPTCRACRPTFNEEACNDNAYDEICPDLNYVCVANFTRDQRGTIISYSRGCVEVSLVPICPTQSPECTNVANKTLGQPSTECYTCESHVKRCDQLTTVAPSSCPIPGTRLACKVCNETGNMADVQCNDQGIWTPCEGPDVSCLEIKHRDPRGTLTRFVRQCSTVGFCEQNRLTTTESCVTYSDASKTCQSCVQTMECRDEPELCPTNRVPLCYNCEASNQKECEQQHKKDSDYMQCPSGKCMIITKFNIRGEPISYSSTCAPSSCNNSCIISGDGSETCKYCNDYVKCSGSPSTGGNACKPHEILSCFKCKGTDEKSCKQSDDAGWVPCPHGNCITEYYQNADGGYEEYRMNCGRPDEQCPRTVEQRQGIAGWTNTYMCEKSSRCSCYGDDKILCNDKDNDFYDTPLCRTCPISHTFEECDARTTFKECPSTYCIQSADKDKNQNLISVKKYCSPDICEKIGTLVTSERGENINEERCTLYNDTLSGKAPKIEEPSYVTPSYYHPTTTIDSVAKRYNCSTDETLRCKTCQNNVCDYYESCTSKRDPICEVQTTGDSYTSRCVESYQCFSSKSVSCEIPSCKPATYKVTVFMTLETTFKPDYGVIGSRAWWSVCLVVMSVMDAFYRGVPGYVGITCGTMTEGSIEIEYFVHFDIPVTNETAVEVGKSTAKGLMQKEYSIKLNKKMITATGSHVIINDNYNITGYDFRLLCEDLQVVCDNGQQCVFDNKTYKTYCNDATSGFKELLPIVIPLSVLTPLSIILVAVLVVIAAKRSKKKTEEAQKKIVNETMNRYHVSDTGTWSTLQRAFSPDYKSNWRSYIGSGFHGDPKEYAWDPDDASSVTVHRSKALAGSSWNFTDFPVPNNDEPMTEDEELDDIVRRAQRNDEVVPYDERESSSDEFRIPRPALGERSAARFPYRMPQFQGFRGLNRPMSFFGGSSEGTQ